MGKADSEFKTTIRNLWTVLGMPPPEFGGEAEIILSVDGMQVRLRESRDGRHVEIESAAGRLSSDPAEAARQVDRILQESLGALATNSACLHPLPGRRDDLVCSARLAYRLATPLAMQAAVEDVLAMSEYWRGILVRNGGARPSGPALSPEASTVIFRP